MVRRGLILTWLLLLAVLLASVIYSLVSRPCWTMAAAGRAVACPPVLPDSVIVGSLIAVACVGAVALRLLARRSPKPKSTS